MHNEFEHLSNGLTVIYCQNTKSEITEEVYIDTTLFNYVSAFNIEWKVWDDSKGLENKENPKIIGGTDSENNNKVTFLRRIIGEYLYGKEYHFSQLNNKHYDLRKVNIFKFKPGTGHSGKVRTEREKLLDALPELQSKEDIDITHNNIDVVEYEDNLLIIENSRVTKTITFAQANAIVNFLNTQA